MFFRRKFRSGEWGEKIAATYLRREKGFRILGKRVRVGTRDEIDLLARDGGCLVFVEVKTRASELFGRPMDAVDRDKRHTLSRAAVRYIGKLRDRDVVFRFDVVEVIGTEEGGVVEIRHIEQAFELDRRYVLP